MVEGNDAAREGRRERKGEGVKSLKFIFGGRKQALSPQWMDSALFLTLLPTQLNCL